MIPVLPSVSRGKIAFPFLRSYAIDFERGYMLTRGVSKSIHYLLLVSSKHVLASAWYNAQHSSSKRLDEEMYVRLSCFLAT
ncbi:unnamed protein product [Larinioides sclopetarius]|uniref:Maturase K n=1 Tax=Larinioides sclopetarius TaxID=280406 RepID=A0AAV2A8G3_9ARAC